MLVNWLIRLFASLNVRTVNTNTLVFWSDCFSSGHLHPKNSVNS